MLVTQISPASAHDGLAEGLLTPAIAFCADKVHTAGTTNAAFLPAPPRNPRRVVAGREPPPPVDPPASCGDSGE